MDLASLHVQNARTLRRVKFAIIACFVVAGLLFVGSFASHAGGLGGPLAQSHLPE